ncbi:PhoX family protein [Maribacter sp.]|nr:PhoX family protein [Maribacter sp.]
MASIGFLALSRCVLEETPFGNLNLILDPKNYLDLPQGFSYKIISKSGDMMDDGFFVPGRPDGMGAFEGSTNDKVILVRNHENSPEPVKNSPFGSENELIKNLDASVLYDAGQMNTPSLGGTTTLIYNEESQKLEKQFLSLVGTNRNCAGGVTPWKSWLSCEEDVTKKSGEVEQDHGYVFEVPAMQQGVTKPIPLTDMGRFNHEAVAVDPTTGIVYQTEDRNDGLIYRFIPKIKTDLKSGGRLQVLAVKDKRSFDSRNWDDTLMKLNEPLKVEWLDIDNVTSPNDDLRYRGFEAGAARFARGEGMWFGEDELYFACTNGGPKELGQIFRYRLSSAKGSEVANTSNGTLELFAESEDKSVLHMCDNLTISPWGAIFLCEDNGRSNHIRIINQNGQINTFATNKSSKSELAGIVFSPSGKTLFVNIQENGDTLAITGPWNTLI